MRGRLASNTGPSAPDWENTPTRERVGAMSASEAFNRRAGSVLIAPKACGPIMRIPYRRAIRINSRCDSTLSPGTGPP